MKSRDDLAESKNSNVTINEANKKRFKIINTSIMHMGSHFDLLPPAKKLEDLDRRTPLEG